MFVELAYGKCENEMFRKTFVVLFLVLFSGLGIQI